LKILFAFSLVFQKALIMSFESAVIIILTALGVMLAVLAIGMAAAALWGYAGFKEFVREAAKSHVAEAMAVKMKEYPTADQLIQTIQNQLIARTSANSVAPVTATDVQVDSASVAPTYPGKEQPDAHNGQVGGSDARPNNS
jgi:hypothetical protein